MNNSPIRARRFHAITRKLRFPAMRFYKDGSGQSGIEFALLLPLMALLVAATIDLGQALMIRRKINQIAAMTSDIISQEESWDSSEVTTVLQGSSLILAPFDTDDLTILVGVLDFDSKGSGTVNWSQGFQTDALASGKTWPDSISSDVVESGVQMVVAHVEYNVQPALTGLLLSLTGTGTYRFTGIGIARPRIGDEVSLD